MFSPEQISYSLHMADKNQILVYSSSKGSKFKCYILKHSDPCDAEGKNQRNLLPRYCFLDAKCSPGKPLVNLFHIFQGCYTVPSPCRNITAIAYLS